MPARFIFVLRRCGRAFAADRRGVSVVEFALLLPLMLTMFFGSIEITDAISADRQITLVASTVADITSQYSCVTDNDVANIKAVASAVLTPFSPTNMKVTLTSVAIDANGNAAVDWSQTNTGAARSGTVTNSIPPALRVASTWLIWGEATYAYRPIFGRVVTGTLNMSSQIFMRPRLSSSVQYKPSSCA